MLVGIVRLVEVHVTDLDTKAPISEAGVVDLTDDDRASNIILAINKLSRMKNPVSATLSNRIAGQPRKIQKAQITIFVRWAFQFLTIVNMAAASKLKPTEFEVWLDKSLEEARHPNVKP